jgi:DNA-binding transcriptional regulator YdaS (Cro superfamily)
MKIKSAPYREPGMIVAIEAVGLAKIGEPFGITAQAVAQWTRVPAERLVKIEEITGVPRHVLRPDLYEFSE